MLNIPHDAQCYLQVLKDVQGCECKLRLASWVGCLISSLLFSLLVSGVMCSSSASPHTRTADLQVASLDASLHFSSPQATSLL